VCGTTTIPNLLRRASQGGHIKPEAVGGLHHAVAGTSGGRGGAEGGWGVAPVATPQSIRGVSDMVTFRLRRRLVGACNGGASGAASGVGSVVGRG
jgi:hypothetical protein